MRRVVWCLFPLLVVGCSLETWPLVTADAAASADASGGDGDGPVLPVLSPDVGADGGGAEVDPDTSAPDMPGPPDSAPSGDAGSDTSPVDASPPDSAPPPEDTGTEPPSCDSLFASVAPSYEACGERADECEFYTVTSGGPSCAELCMLGGRTCIESYAEDGDAHCTRTSAYGCDHRHSDGICVCTR